MGCFKNKRLPYTRQSTDFIIIVMDCSNYYFKTAHIFLYNYIFSYSKDFVKDTLGHKLHLYQAF